MLAGQFGRFRGAVLDERGGNLNAGRPGWADGLQFSYPDAPTQRHRVARYVMSKVRIMYAADPSAWVALSARLDAEYRALGE